MIMILVISTRIILIILIILLLLLLLIIIIIIIIPTKGLRPTVESAAKWSDAALKEMTREDCCHMAPAPPAPPAVAE